MVGKSRGASAIVALVVAAAVVINAVSDNLAVATACYMGVLVGAGIGAWVGAERGPRGRRTVPRLIAAGISLTALGDALWSGLDLLGAGTDVSIADPPWFVSYVFLCAALWVVLARSRTEVPGGRRVAVDSLADVLTIVVVSVLIFWSFSIDAIVADDSVTPFVRTVWAAYPVADAVLLALVVRVLMSRSARASIDSSFAIGVCLWLAADVAYLQVPEVGTTGAWMDVAWMIAPVLMARAAWRPSPQQAEASDPAAQGNWMGLLMLAVAPLLVPPALELVADLRGEPDEPMQLFIGTALLIALAFVRTARLLRSEKRALQQLAVARDVALDASRAKSMFLANMSHEIRTPLTTVLASAELFEDTPLDDFQLKLLAKMSRSGELLRSLVEGILDFSRIEAGKLKLASTPFDLHAMVADATDAYMPRAIRLGLQFESNVDRLVPRAVVGDRDRLLQVITNLLDNALKFTPHGQVSLDVRPAIAADETGRVGETMELIVSDTGIGIPEENQELVFESFYQVDGSTTRTYGGNGLGLAICKELTELMGGSITIQSQFGAGSTFVVRIPMIRAHAIRETPLLRAV